MLYYACNHLSMLGLKLKNICKSGLWLDLQDYFTCIGKLLRFPQHHWNKLIKLWVNTSQESTTNSKYKLKQTRHVCIFVWKILWLYADGLIATVLFDFRSSGQPCFKYKKRQYLCCSGRYIQMHDMWKNNNKKTTELNFRCSRLYIMHMYP